MLPVRRLAVAVAMEAGGIGTAAASGSPVADGWAALPRQREVP